MFRVINHDAMQQSNIPSKRGFASDNNSGVHPAILQAMIDANVNHTIGYGDDAYTRQAIELFKKEFGTETEVIFVFNGTGANVVALQAICRPYQAIIANSLAHINVDECASPEKMTGSKILTIDSLDGKLTAEQIKPLLHAIGFEHHAQPAVISITQSTEVGTVYTLDELRKLCDFAHQNGLLVHMDGARVANAAVSLGCSLKEMTRDVGVDVLSFGGTKNGLMFGEAVLFFSPKQTDGIRYIRKQSAQLYSKMRFISAQFIALFSNDLWRINARHSNEMAQLLAQKIAHIPQVKITRPVQSNGLFVIVPQEIIKELQTHFFFYVWDYEKSEVRWMTAFDTTPDDIELFVTLLQKLVKGYPSIQ
jgi:threonine aldolase